MSKTAHEDEALHIHEVMETIESHRMEIQHRLAEFLLASCVRVSQDPQQLPFVSGLEISSVGAHTRPNSHQRHSQNRLVEELSVFDSCVVHATLEEMILVAQGDLRLSDEVVFLAVVYLQRYLHRAHRLLTTRNVRPLFLTALLLSSKFLIDTPYNNLTYSYLGQCNVQDINVLEVEFLRSISFHLNASHQAIFKIMELFANDVLEQERNEQLEIQRRLSDQQIHKNSGGNGNVQPKNYASN